MKFWTIAGAALFCAMGCGDNKRGIGRDTTDATPADTAGGDGDATAGDSGDATGPGDGDATPDDTSAAPLPNACAEDGDCAKGACRSGVCVVDPPASAVGHITDPTTNTETDQWPNLDCVDQSAAPIQQTDTATLYGAVERFGKGRKTTEIHVDVLLADGFDPSACEHEATLDAKQTCYRSYGTPVGSTVSVPANPASVPEDCTRHEDCPLGYQCITDSERASCEEQFGLYEIPDVPLETPLVLRSYATTNESQWHDTYVFHVVLHAAEVTDGRVQYDAQMVSEGQWILTSNTVGLPPIGAANGAIGGRVRDCGDGRDSWPIADVRLGLANPGRSFVYFNDLEDDTVPLIDRETTDILGRFAALDVPAGWNRIAGSARVDGQVVTVGGSPVYVAPGALSIVSWPGTQPYWRQN